MADRSPVDSRTPEDIAAAQRALVKILAVATGIPVLWVTLLAANGLRHGADAPRGSEGFYWFVVVWGLMSPLVWVAANGYTWSRIKRGDMDAGRVLPIVPALWIIVWFASQLAG